MSLLLQALQKAAKNRESGTVPVEDLAPSPAPSPPPTLEPPPAILPPAFALESKAEPAARELEPELALAEEDLFEPDEPLPEEPVQRFEPFAASATASPSAAATILRAGDAPTANWVDWLRDRPVWALGIAAGIFLTFYFVYVYLQISHPGILRGEFMRQCDGLDARIDGVINDYVDCRALFNVNDGGREPDLAFQRDELVLVIEDRD